MTAQKGRDLLLKITRAKGTSNPTSFYTAMGLRAQTISLNAATVDISDATQDHRWRELMSGIGLKSMSITGEGIFRDGEADEEIRKFFVDGTIDFWQIHIPHFYTITGKFQITSLEYAGEYDNVLTWRLSLESSGELTWVVARV